MQREATPDGDRMAARVARHDWAATPLGPIADWPQSLKTAVDLVLAAGHAMQLAWGPQCTVLYNDAYVPLLGDRHPAALGAPLHDAWPDRQGDVRAMARRVFAGEALQVGEVPLRLQGDSGADESWWTLCASPVRGESGTVAGVLVVAVEATARIAAQRAEAQARESRDSLRHLLDGMGEGFGILAPDFTILEHNREALRMDGRPREEVVGRSQWAVYPGTEGTPAGRLLKQAMALRVPVSLEHRYAWEASGRARWLEMRASPTDDGALAVFWRDVTDRRDALDALRRSEERLRLAVQVGGLGLWDWNIPTGQVHWSDEHFAMQGYRAGEVIPSYEAWLARVHPDDREAAQGAITAAMENGGDYEHEFRTLHPDGAVHWLAARGRFFYEDGRAVRMIGAMADVTEHRRVTDALRRGQQRQAFLLALADTLRPLYEPARIKAEAMRVLGRHLGVNRAHYYEVDASGESFDAASGYLHHAAPIPARGRMDDLGPCVRTALDAGRTVAADDVQADPEIGEAERDTWASLGVRAFVGVPLVKEGRWVGALGLHCGAPRAWDAEEVALAEDVAERTWAAVERSRAEAAAHEREQRYRTLFQAIDEGFAIVEIVRVDGRAVDAVFREVNEAFERHTGLHDARGRRVSEMFDTPDPQWFDTHDRVARSGVAERSETWSRDTDRYYRQHVSRIGGEGSDRVAVVFEDITARKRTEMALRRSEERQVFLLALSDALRPIDEPAQVLATASRLLGEHLGVARVAYAEVAADADTLTLLPAWQADGAVPPPGRRGHLSDFGSVRAAGFRAGRTQVTADTRADADIEDDRRGAYAAAGIIATVAVPLIKDGRLLAILGVHHDVARDWTAAEVALVEQVAERTWAAVERARAETALRASEARLREREADLARVQRIGGVGGVDIDVAGGLTSRRSPEYLDLHGLPAETDEETHADWLARVHPDDRRGAEAALFQALASDAGSYELEYRIVRPRDGAVRWIAARADIERDAAGRALRLVGAHVDITEQKRTQLALRESEERFKQFANASASGLWIRNAASLSMEYTSPAIARIYGVADDALLGGVQCWAAMIVPDDRQTALAHLEDARCGEAVVHEFRIQRATDQAFRWIRNIDFPLYDDGRILRIGGIAEDVTESRMAVEHQGVLLAELQHRVRNIMAIIRSIASRTGDGVGSIQEYAQVLAGRLDTFARIQSLLTRQANTGVGIATIVRDELSALAHHEGQIDIDGPDVTLSPKAAETMTLAIHELATNALKYGALSTPQGAVRARWRIDRRGGGSWLVFDWDEHGTPPAPASLGPRRVGFGSELIEGRIPYELNGRGKVTLVAGQASCHLEFPLTAGASILETGAPQRATVFGGAIDMNGHNELAGQRVLVVEDDYYLAADTARALGGAGAQVLGPCATEDAARAQIAATPPSCAVLDIDLQGGRSFGLAADFRREGVPFIFITGYDQDVIPPEFAGVVRLQKPVEFRQVVAALAGALAGQVAT